jgi:uncharacterized protein (DUF1697 family)
MEKISYLALLRGINVGGKNVIKMDFLKEIFEKMEFYDVKTYIQSGNILFKDTEIEKEKLARKIEKTLLKNTNYEIMVLVITLSDLENIIKDIPKEFGNNIKKYTYDVLFLMDKLKPKEIMNKIKMVEGEDKIYEGKKALYVKRFSEKLTGSYIVKALKISPNITVRNLKVTKELYGLMLERNNNIE